MTFAEYLQKVAITHLEAQKKGVNLRVGQVYMNCLPDPLYDEIMERDHEYGIIIDPFYDDEILPQFLAYIESRFEA